MNENDLLSLVENIKSKMNTENTKVDENNNLNNILNSFTKENNTKNNENFENIEIKNNENTEVNTGFDISTLLKVQKILSNMNKSDPRKNLLLSLKPFLRESRQEKINEYITYLSIGSAIGIFNKDKE
ncbi:MAG: hypothetical protein RSE41_03450 [Clostridia bacterium]